MYGVCRKMRNAAEMPAAERMSSKSPYDGTDRIRFDGCNLSLRPLQREAPLFSLCKYMVIFLKFKGKSYNPGNSFSRICRKKKPYLNSHSGTASELTHHFIY